MTKRKEYPLMGKRVRVYAQYERRVTESKPWIATWERIYPKQKYGWVVGYRTVYEGEIIEGHYGAMEDVSAYFAQSKSIPTLLVTFHPRHKPVYVPIDAFHLLFKEV